MPPVAVSLCDTPRCALRRRYVLCAVALATAARSVVGARVCGRLLGEEGVPVCEQRSIGRTASESMGGNPPVLIAAPPITRPSQPRIEGTLVSAPRAHGHFLVPDLVTNDLRLAIV